MRNGEKVLQKSTVESKEMPQPADVRDTFHSIGTTVFSKRLGLLVSYLLVAAIPFLPHVVFAQEFTTVEQICDHYAGKPLGVKDGLKVDITCDNIHLAYKQLVATMPEPTFREMRDKLRKHRTVNFEDGLLNDPTFKGRCSRDKTIKPKKYRCNFPPGADAFTDFTLGKTNQLEKVDLYISRSVLRPATLNILAKLGISEGTPAYSEIVLYLVVIRARQLSFPDELYSTDGQTLKVEIWPWLQP